MLFDEPGPRGRRRVRILTVLSTVVIAGLIAVAMQRFAANGQLAAEKRRPFTLPYVQQFLRDGLQSTLQITVVSGVLALPLGVVFALLRLSHRAAIRRIATTYIEIFRSLPLLLLILVFVLALPPLGVNPPIFWKVVIPIVMCNVAVLAEIFRAGINAVPKGQTDAALAVGLTRGQAIPEVVFPQAVRMIIRSLVTQLVSLLKDSTLSYAASFAELLRTANVLTARLHIFIQVYIVISLIYFVINDTDITQNLTLPWPAMDHLNGQMVQSYLSLPPYGVSILTQAKTATPGA